MYVCFDVICTELYVVSRTNVTISDALNLHCFYSDWTRIVRNQSKCLGLDFDAYTLCREHTYRDSNMTSSSNFTYETSGHILWPSTPLPPHLTASTCFPPTPESTRGWGGILRGDRHHVSGEVNPDLRGVEWKRNSDLWFIQVLFLIMREISAGRTIVPYAAGVERSNCPSSGSEFEWHLEIVHGVVAKYRRVKDNLFMTARSVNPAPCSCARDGHTQLLSVLWILCVV